MEVKNNAVFTGLVFGEPKLRKTKFGKNYVAFDFKVNEDNDFTIRCVCWNSDLAEYFANHVDDSDSLVITGYLSEYTKQHKLQLVLESYEGLNYDFVELDDYIVPRINHVHLHCPIISSEIKTFNSRDYAILKLKLAKDKTCLCISDKYNIIKQLDELDNEVGITRYWADISGELSPNYYFYKDDYDLVIDTSYLSIEPEYDREALLDAACDYDPIFD